MFETDFDSFRLVSNSILVLFALVLNTIWYKSTTIKINYHYHVRIFSSFLSFLVPNINANLNFPLCKVSLAYLPLPLQCTSKHQPSTLICCQYLWLWTFSYVFFWILTFIVCPLIHLNVCISSSSSSSEHWDSYYSWLTD